MRTRSAEQTFSEKKVARKWNWKEMQVGLRAQDRSLITSISSPSSRIGLHHHKKLGPLWVESKVRP
jgi:hypothetical protein